jgi:hypothetical protein
LGCREGVGLTVGRCPRRWILAEGLRRRRHGVGEELLEGLRPTRGRGSARGGSVLTGGRLQMAVRVRPLRWRTRPGRRCAVDGVSSRGSRQPSGEGGCQPQGRGALSGKAATQPGDGTALCSGCGVEQRSDRDSTRARRRQVNLFFDEGPMKGGVPQCSLVQTLKGGVPQYFNTLSNCTQISAHHIQLYLLLHVSPPLSLGPTIKTKEALRAAVPVAFPCRDLDDRGLYSVMRCGRKKLHICSPGRFTG